MTPAERPVADNLFPGLRLLDIEAGGARIRLRVGGEGAPLLRLHGYPQIHGLRHEAAQRLKDRFGPLALWREPAQDVRGHVLPGGHDRAEEVPDLVAAEFKAFFGAAS